jgi:organic radical activating enzyme
MLIDEVEKFIPKYKVDIVLTGGEPLLYWSDVEFQSFLKHYITKKYSVTIETNGSIDIELKEDWQKQILFSLSVKLSNSGENKQKRVNAKLLSNIINFADESYLKFVVSKDFLPLASKEIDEILNEIPKVEVFVMPLGDSAKLIDYNSLSVIEFALAKGFKYSDRLHIRVWDNKRGV